MHLHVGNFGKITELRQSTGAWSGTTEAWSRAGNRQAEDHAFALGTTVGGYVAAMVLFVKYWR